MAEEIILNQSTTGAGNDLERATDMARKMVCEWGMSDKIRPPDLRPGPGTDLPGPGDRPQHRDYSEETARLIDSEVKRFVTENYQRATDLLTRHRETLETLAEALLEHETLNQEQVNDIVYNAVARGTGTRGRRPDSAAGAPTSGPRNGSRPGRSGLRPRDYDGEPEETEPRPMQDQETPDDFPDE